MFTLALTRAYQGYFSTCGASLHEPFGRGSLIGYEKQCQLRTGGLSSCFPRYHFLLRLLLKLVSVQANAPLSILHSVCTTRLFNLSWHCTTRKGSRLRSFWMGLAIICLNAPSDQTSRSGSTPMLGTQIGKESSLIQMETDSTKRPWTTQPAECTRTLNARLRCRLKLGLEPTRGGERAHKGITFGFVLFPTYQMRVFRFHISCPASFRLLPPPPPPDLNSKH